MKPTTMAGLMAGSVLGLAMGAGLMMMPQSKQMKRVIAKGMHDMKKFTGKMPW